MAKRVKTEQTYLTICIQQIHTTWTKKSRGGSGAIARNRVPQELVLPEVVNVAHSPTVLYHRLWYKEQDDLFGLCRSDFEVSNTLPLQKTGVRIAETSEGLRAYWEYHSGMGAPSRPSKSEASLILEVGQWGRILYIGRHSPDYEGDWWYDRRVFNIGIFWNPMVDVFVASQPVKIFSQMAHLW